MNARPKPLPSTDIDAPAVSDGLTGWKYAERVRLLYSSIRLVALATLINAAILAVLQRNAVGLSVAVPWFVCIALSIGWRVLLSYRFHRAAPADAEMAAWGRRYIVSAFVTGAVWGVAGMLMLPADSPPHQVLTAFVLGGMAAGAVTTLSRLFAAFVAFTVPTLVPVAIHFALRGGETGYGMAGMYALFLVYLLYAARAQSDALGHSLDLAQKNRALVGNLTAQSADAERLNLELRREIDVRGLVEAELREREGALANAQRIAGLGSWQWDMRTNLITGSEEAKRIFGISPEVASIRFDDFLAMVHPDDRQGLSEAIQQAARQSAPYSFQHRVVMAGGVERMVHERGEIVFGADGQPLLMNGTSHDVTDLHRIHTELRAAQVQAEAASQAKSQFLANMSHEFRTPLNAIIGYSEILREDAEAAGQSQGIVDLDRINTAGRHLLALVNEVLDFSRIEAGRTELFQETFDLSALIDEVAATVRPLIESNRNTLVIDYPRDLGPIYADATKLRQIFYNLLSNAAKFTEAGRIEVTARRRTDNGDWFILEVRDSGIGIPAERIETIFNAFDQLDPGTTRKYGGTGLGLAITRHFCEAMGGAITVESAPGVGSTFTVRLPAAGSDD